MEGRKVRAEFWEANPQAYTAMRGFSTYLEKCSIDAGLRELIKIRASQINGCAYCVDMHVQEALKRGESHNRLHRLCVWRESPDFTDAERAALELTEAVTRIAEHGVPDALYERTRLHFNLEQYADLLATINVINSWNRFMVAMGQTPPLRSNVDKSASG